jgi:hypothetical protein
MASMSMRSPGDCVAALDPARRTGEIEVDGVFVRAGPFGDDASVVVGRGVERAADGAAEVDSMHPHVKMKQMS